MTFKIAVTGGKGGVGKTLISVNLAAKLAVNKKVLLIDCDTDNPNCHLLLGIPSMDAIQWDNVEPIPSYIPKINEESCTKCGICSKKCYRHAIIQFKDQFPVFTEHLCTGCQLCERLCPNGAIVGETKKLGLYFFKKEIRPNLDICIGELSIGDAYSEKVVDFTIGKAQELPNYRKYDYIIIDSAPGVHCDVKRVLESVDHVFCVTEPTPFGLYDLKRVLELVKLVNRRSYIIVNRSNITEKFDRIESFAKNNYIPLIGAIPNDPIVVEDYNQGLPFALDDRTFPAKSAFEVFLKNMNTEAFGGETND